MNRILITRLITRHTAFNNQQLHTTTRLSNKNDSSSSSESSDSDDEKLKRSTESRVQDKRSAEAKNETNKRLEALLEQMENGSSKSKTLDRAIPVRTPLPKPVRKPSLEEQLKGAAKEAASTLGGDVEQTESQLLDKIFSAGTPTLESAETPSTTSSNSSLSDLLAGMKIDRKPQRKSTKNDSDFRSSSMEHFARQFQDASKRLKSLKRAPTTYGVSANLFGGERLNIFDPIVKTSDDFPTLKTWKLLEEKDLKLLQLRPPENIFEEMIQWTDKGILWKFPINNEIEMEEEENIHFSEHVFMDRHLKGWCPKAGPIRHFMDLVCIGLSKNPYMTVEEKKGHIMWYREFFESKRELLKEIGALDSGNLSSTATKQIQS